MDDLKLKGYRVYLPSRIGMNWYGYIQFYKQSLQPSRTNQRMVCCMDCNEKLKAGMGIKHWQQRNNGFVCINCARGMILRHGKFGYIENILSNLQCCSYDHKNEPGVFSAENVAEHLLPYREEETV